MRILLIALVVLACLVGAAVAGDSFVYMTSYKKFDDWHSLVIIRVGDHCQAVYEASRYANSVALASWPVKCP